MMMISSSRSNLCLLVGAMLVFCFSLMTPIVAFAPSSSRRRASSTITTPSKLGHQVTLSSTTDAPSADENGMIQQEAKKKSYFLSREEIKPILEFGKGTEKEKVVNAFGLWCLIVSLITSPIWAAAMSLLNLIYKVNGDAWDANRSVYDTTGKIWAKSWLTLVNSMPSFSGHVEQLQQGNGPCLYVANHASWLDIPILCTVLDPVFKFIAKGELRGVPCIGQQLVGGHHILIDREDRKSQIRTFKDGIKWLKQGVPLMAFPEGKRSKDGRLMEFKGGLFSMAAKTKCPIVPITISHAHAVMPCNALFPVQSGRGKLHVHVHEPIDAVGRSEDELVALVRQAFVSTLPLEQQPLEREDESQHPNVEDAPVSHQRNVQHHASTTSNGIPSLEIKLSKQSVSTESTSDDPTNEVVEVAN